MDNPENKILYTPFWKEVIEAHHQVATNNDLVIDVERNGFSAKIRAATINPEYPMVVIMINEIPQESRTEGLVSP